MASEPLECKTVVLRVSIHCQGCKKKVKKVLQSVDGVYKCDVDAPRNKVTVAVTGNVDANTLIAKLRKSGKQAEPWPEEQKQKEPTNNQSQETKNQNNEPDKPNEPTEKPGSSNAEPNAAEPSNPTPSPEPNKSTNETPKPAQESTESTTPEKHTNANASASASANVNANASDETKKMVVEQSNEAKRKGKQQQEQKAIDAKVTVELEQGSYAHYMPPLRHPPPLEPVHVMSYNVARPSMSAAYYATAPMPMPMARPAPSQDYMYSPHYYPQPSPDYYYGTPQPSAFSPPRDSYGDLFNDENANSCSVM